MASLIPLAKPRSSRVEVMWYESWQSGYDDILKRGYPKPADKRTILAELRSPHVEDFLHGSSAGVPFLVSKRARDVLRHAGLKGFKFGPVSITKIATKGARKRETQRGEPEDSILKSRGIQTDSAPELFSVLVTAGVEIRPDYESGKTPSDYVSPFNLPNCEITHDLWRPHYNGRPFSAWAFCSEKFRFVCEAHALSNIRFETFDVFMGNFRDDVAP